MSETLGTVTDNVPNADTISADSLVADDVFTAVVAWLSSIMPAGVEIVKGQDNRVAAPAVPDFIVITPGTRTRLSSNIITYNRTTGQRNVTTHSSFELQVDVYGENSSNNVQAIAILARDDSAFYNAAFASLTGNIIDITDPTQVAWDTPEQQFEERWTCTLTVQVNVTVSMPQDFAVQLAVTTNSF